MLKARLGGKHLRFTDAERCRLARKAARPGAHGVERAWHSGHNGDPFALVSKADCAQVDVQPPARAGRA